jgi:hypothetical protein
VRKRGGLTLVSIDDAFARRTLTGRFAQRKLRFIQVTAGKL